MVVARVVVWGQAAVVLAVPVVLGVVPAVVVAPGLGVLAVVKAWVMWLRCRQPTQQGASTTTAQLENETYAPPQSSSLS